MHFLTALMKQNNDLTQRYNLNIVILIDGLLQKENELICPHLNFYEMPSFLALARYLPAAMSVFTNSLPNIQCKLYVAPTSSLILSKDKVGLQNPILLTEPHLFPDIQTKIEAALGAKKYQKLFKLSDYWGYKPLDQFIPIDKSFCIFADQLKDDVLLKKQLVQKILFFSNNNAIIPHHSPFEGLFPAKAIHNHRDEMFLQNAPDYGLLQDHKETDRFYMTAPTAPHNPEYIIVENKAEYDAAFDKLQKQTLDNIVKTYPILPYIDNHKVIKIHTVGQKILPMGFKCDFKHHKKKNVYTYEPKKTPFMLDVHMLRSVSYFHKYLQSHSSVYQTYYIYQNPQYPNIYRLHKTVSSDGQGYSKIALHMEKNAKKINRTLKKMPPDVIHYIDILPINHLVYIPFFNQFMRQKNARLMQNTAQDIEDVLDQEKATHHNNLKSG